MAFCMNCGKQLPDNAKFCVDCGAALGCVSEQTRRNTEVEGKIHKCPNCGNTINAYESVCNTCGHEIRSVTTESRVDELAKKLETVATLEQKNELIRNFHIPNTKEDICEFFILATSQINAGGNDIDAWYAKLEQAYQKAKICFGSSPEFQNLNQLYHDAKKKKKSRFFFNTLKKSRMLQCLIIAAIGFVITIIGNVGGYNSGDENSPFYMMGVLGLFPIIGAGIYALAGIKNKDDEKD